jgi:hypothetical protein
LPASSCSGRAAHGRCGPPARATAHRSSRPGAAQRGAPRRRPPAARRAIEARRILQLGQVETQFRPQFRRRQVRAREMVGIGAGAKGGS